MKFQMKDKEYILKGEKAPRCALAVVSSEKLSKVRSKTTQIAMIQCFSLKMECCYTELQTKNPPDCGEEIPQAL